MGEVRNFADNGQDRFATWRKNPARLLLAALFALLVASALIPIGPGTSKVQTTGFIAGVAGRSDRVATPRRDADLALYDRVIKRIEQGENYYSAAVEEHRKADYPVRPGFAVRLPTLAFIDMWLGMPGQIAAAFLLMLATLWAWWHRLRDEGVPPQTQRMAIAFLFLGLSLGLNPYYYVLHELWAGMLIALAFGLHRPGRKWIASLVVAALALAIREHALPFVALMAVYAIWRREWKEAAAWSALIAVFLIALSVHLELVAQLTVPSDRLSAPWVVARGLSGWLANVSLSSNLHLLPHWLAGPVIVAMVFGWSGWKSPAGAFGTVLCLGYGLAFMIAGRPENFYWGAVIAPAMFVGLAFVPMALRSLVKSAAADARQ